MLDPQTVYFALLTMVGVVIWVNKLRVGGPLLENRKRDPNPLGFTDVLIVCGSWLLSPAIAVAILQWAEVEYAGDGATPEGEGISLIFVYGLQLVIILICILYLSSRYRRVSATGLDFRNWAADLRIGLVWFFLIVPPVLLVQVFLSLWVPYSHGTIETLKKSQSALPLFGTWFSAVLCAPIVEEFVCRGVLQGWMQRLGNTELGDFGPIIYGGDFSDDKSLNAKSEVLVGQALADRQVYFDSSLRWLPIFFTATLFASMHLGQGAAPVSLFLLAIGLGYLYRQTGSIVPGLIVHLLLNLQTVFWVTLTHTLGGR